MRLAAGIIPLLVALVLNASILPSQAIPVPQPSFPASAGSAPRVGNVQGTTVSGVVHDSIAGRPLRGAIVQLVSSVDASHFAHTELSDSVGSFSFAAVPAGEYTLGFFHPLLDSLGLPPFGRSVTVAHQDVMRIDLAIPGARRMRDIVCDAKGSVNGGAAVVGFVRDARDRSPVGGAHVTALWDELAFAGRGIQQRTARRAVTAEENGRYVLCNVPGPGSITLIASNGADSTDLVEIDVPADGFVQRELFLGKSRMANAVMATAAADTTLRGQTMRVGDQSLSGTVVSLESGQPVRGATIGMLNGPQTQANEQGQWILQNVAAGSRTIEARAVGRVPVRRTVDVVSGTLPVRIAMSSHKAMLDTLKITAGLSSTIDLVEFERRRKSSGIGRFFTAADIAKRGVIEASDILRNVPGVELRRGETTDSILMKGIFTETCAPRLLINGTPMDAVTTDTFSSLVRPERVIGIEIYSAASVPAQFQGPMTGCGSIVVWVRN